MEYDKDNVYYQSCLEAILTNSPQAKVFCLIHKMDLVSEKDRQNIFEGRVSVLTKLSNPILPVCFSTSIWDETLYKVCVHLFHSYSV